jgi:hypothetical protein
MLLKNEIKQMTEDSVNSHLLPTLVYQADIFHVFQVFGRQVAA